MQKVIILILLKCHPVLMLVLLFYFFSLPATANDLKRVVNSLAELQEEVIKAQPGDTIIIADGKYKEKEFDLVAKGIPGKPIVIRSQTIGKVTIQGPLSLSGSYLCLSGVDFTEGGAIEINGKGIRVTRCTITNTKVEKWIVVHPGSSNIEIDHCCFKEKEINLEKQKGCQLMRIVVRNQDEKHHIHHNHFYDIPKGAGNNGFETIQLITEGNPFDPEGGNCNTVIEQNLFERCNGESEIISVKSNGNVIRRNTFRACAGELVLRTGDNNVVSGNYFFGDDEKNSGGVRLQGTDQVVANNYFHGLGQSAIALMDGGSNKFYVRVERADIVFNTIINCKHALIVGLGHPEITDAIVPKQCLVAGNIFFSKSDNLPGSELIKLVDNDQPEAWRWNDNIAYGELGIPEPKGVSTRDPHIRFLENGLAVPTKKTPMAKKSLMIPSVEYDFFGKKRNRKKTIGAVEYARHISVVEPLTEEQVGPLSEMNETR
ncbi:MAG: polysaccharide lyase 6 family protein [Mangrovibacterium sp.]